MTHVITRNCCNDASCIPVCPVDCIHPTPDEPGYGTAEMLYIDAGSCIDCGACVDACPVNAIAADFDLDEGDEPFIALNASYYATPIEAATPRAVTTARADPPPEFDSPLHIAIVGSGPAAMYAARALLATKGIDLEVTIFERLPTPWGLIRSGVAPDHQQTKSVVSEWSGIATRPNVLAMLNVEVGRDVTHQELLSHHHAVIYASGMPRGRDLGLPGEFLAGSHTAAEFVGWYNGHPDAFASDVDLSHERAVVVGNGNVALDVARLLVLDEKALRHTDVPDNVLDALTASKVREVVILGRRGPKHAAFTSAELIALGNADVDVALHPSDVEAVEAALSDDTLAAITRFKLIHLRALAARSRAHDRSIEFRFNRTPVEIIGSRRVESFVAAFGSTQEQFEAGLVVRAVGFERGSTDPLLACGSRETLDHDQGRLMNSEGRVRATYVAGWAKRGPAGVIGTNQQCAEETVKSLLEDASAGALTPPANSIHDLRAKLASTTVLWAGWQNLDRYERELGRTQGRPRVKVPLAATMISVATEARGGSPATS